MKRILLWIAARLRARRESLAARYDDQERSRQRREHARPPVVCAGCGRRHLADDITVDHEFRILAYYRCPNDDPSTGVIFRVMNLSRPIYGDER